MGILTYLSIQSLERKARMINKNIKRYLVFGIGVLLLAIAFNLFVFPNKLVFGFSGIAIILNKLFNFDPSVVLLIGSSLVLVLSFIVLGKNKTSNSIIGTFLYPLFIKLTATLPNYIDLGTTEPIMLILFGAVLSGLGLGLVFKAGFTTGGADILSQIISKYAKTSIGNSMMIIDGIIISFSLFVFNWQTFMYSIVCLYIISTIADKVILGISTSKSFYIITDKELEIEAYILKNLSHGITILDGQGGYTNKKHKVLMCIVPTREYFLVKENILNIDSNAFFLVTDAYEVSNTK